MSIPLLSVIKTAEQFEELTKLANADEHTVFAPTHLVTRNKAIEGYASIGTPGFPLVLCWMDSKKVKPRESMMLLNIVENHIALSGGSGLFTPVLKTSPFHPHMERLGYNNCGNYDLFLKNL